MSAPLTLGTGLAEITVLARLRQDGRLAPERRAAVRLPGRRRRHGHGDRPADRRVGAAGRVHPEGAAVRRPRHRVPVRDRAAADRRRTGTFTEYDFDAAARSARWTGRAGQNKAGVVAGVVTTPTTRSTRRASPGSRCSATRPRRSARWRSPSARSWWRPIDLAEELGVPVEWFTLSSGAKISMDSGTENMDGVARALRRIITFTQGGGEINIIVAGINVGAQPYWNAEATMLQHTKGILIMTPDSAMVLTGKMSLDYSGGVSAEDNFGLGGYDRVMGPNGEAQYWAPNLTAATEILFAHYDHAYAAPGERYPRRAADQRSAGPGRADLPARAPGQPVHHGRRDLLGGDQQGPQEAVRHPDGDQRDRRPGPRDPGTVGRDGRRGHLGGGGRPPGRVPGGASSASSRGTSRGAGSCRPTARTSSPPARCSRKSSKKTARAINAAVRQPAAGGAGEPVRVRRLTGVAAQHPVGVRRRDRPGHRQLRRPDHLLRGLPLPRRRVRGVLRGAERQHGGRSRSRARSPR